MYSPKYGTDYQKDLKYNIQPKIENEDDKQTDFFKENNQHEDEDPRIVRKSEKNKN